MRRTYLARFVLFRAAGFGVGLLAGEYLDYLMVSFERIPFIVVAGILGGAPLGAALG